jgi:septation ring formation regulator EzrA
MVFEPNALREFLNREVNLSDDEIWQAHIELCEEKISEHENEIANLEKQKEKNRLRLQVVKKLGNNPLERRDRLLRYEGAIERQLYKALNQLERLQRLRAGDNVPAPVEVDMDVDTGQNA